MMRMNDDNDLRSWRFMRRYRRSLPYYARAPLHINSMYPVAAQHFQQILMPRTSTHYSGELVPRPGSDNSLSQTKRNFIGNLLLLESIAQSVRARSAFMEPVIPSQPPINVPYQSRNRYGRPYISGRPLLTCDRQKIVHLFETGMKKIHIAKQLGITHSCVSKVLKKYQDTGSVEARTCRTPSCCTSSCSHDATIHNVKLCGHIRTKRLPFSIENILRTDAGSVVYFSKSVKNQS